MSDGSASSGNSTKAEIVTASPAVTEPKKHFEAKNPLPGSTDNVSADYAEIEEEKDGHKQRGGTLQSVADSTLSTVSSFNSSMRDSTLDGTLLYDNGGQDSFLDNLEPGAHNTPRFPMAAASNYNHLALKADYNHLALQGDYNHLALKGDYEKDPNYVQDHDYEQDPDYQQQKNFDPPRPPAYLLQQQSGRDVHYKSPEKTMRPLSEKLPRVLEQPDYADAIPHCNSLSTSHVQPHNYAELRQSTLDPLPHYTHLDIKTKEHQRGSGLSYVTTDL